MRWRNIFSRKSLNSVNNPSNSLVTLQEFSTLVTLAGGFQQLAQKGYIENCIVNTCIRRTADAMNSIPLKFFRDGKEVDKTNTDKLTRAIIQTILDPSPDMNKNLFLQTVQSEIYIKGESYVFIPENAANRPDRLDALRPDRMTKEQSNDQRVHAYHYNRGDQSWLFTRDSYKIDNETFDNPDTLQGRFNMVIFRNYNPISDVDGLSSITSCAFSVQGHNDALTWNNAVLQNSGKVSGLLSFGESSGGLSPDEIEIIYKKLQEKLTGKNRGGILVSNQSGKFEKFSMTTLEMDFINGIVQRSIDICNTLDYPPYLLGFTGATFNNQGEAKLSLFENSAIPKTENIYNSIATFLSRKYDINFEIKLDIIKVDAMAPRFQQKNDNIIKQFEKNLINQDEARAQLGYEDAPDGTGELFFSEISKTPSFPGVDPNQGA